VIAVPLTLLWLLGMENTVNFLDGVDGLAAGVVGIVALILMIAASTKGPQAVVLLSAALAGACGGFLVFNFSPARIFMGDSGSNFMGLTIGLLSVAGVAKVAAAFSLLIPILALAVPIADTGWAIIRRRRGRVSIAHPDTRHIHHQLLDFGLTQAQTCVVFYCSAAILGSLGLMLFGHRRVLAVAIVLLVVLISTIFGELLQQSTHRLPVPGLRLLLPEPVPPPTA
jgi:UDP-GlcNAc:undecaprenyl-phosphate/decaprenyl-phosphate GlcNAc-1-phosphate transferase